MKKSELTKKIILISVIFLIAVVANIFTTVMLKDDVRNGIWVKGDSMNAVDLDTLSKNGFENIFLHSSAVERFGQENVTNWIKKANSKNMKVHIWVQCFYSNNQWVNPINVSAENFNYPYFNSKVEEIEKYSEIEGLSGIQLDYIRYPGNAHEYDFSYGITGTNAITKFVSMVSNNLKDKSLTLSITLMPEREGKKYYGQDAWILSYYVDAVVPMAYAGNYKEDANWIKNIASYFKGEAMWSKVCMGLQVYESDSNITTLPVNVLKEHFQAALDGGADGVALFTYELMKNWFDLRELSS